MMRKRACFFSTKLSQYILIVTGLVFVYSFVFFFATAKRSVSNEAFAHSKSEIANTSRAIEDLLRQIVCAVSTSSILTQRTLASSDSLYNILEAMITFNPIMTGALVTFKPDSYPDWGCYFMAYVYRDRNTIKRKLQGSDICDYPCIDCYVIPKLLQKNYWSETYYNESGDGVILTTYKRLLTHTYGTTYGVVTGDVSLDKFSRLAGSSKPCEGSSRFSETYSGNKAQACTEMSDS